MSFLKLNIIGKREDSNKTVKVNNVQILVPQVPNIAMILGSIELYNQFKTFMLNPTYIRYGPNETIITWSSYSIQSNIGTKYII